MKNNEIFPNRINENSIKKWKDIGFIDEKIDKNDESDIANIFDIVEIYLNKKYYENENYHGVVYVIIKKLFHKIFLKNQPISGIIDMIILKYKNIVNKNNSMDFDSEFAETFVNDFTTPNEKKHLRAIYNALKIGEKNDLTKLMVGLSQLKTDSCEDYENLDRNWLFSDYYSKLDNSLSEIEKENINNDTLKYFNENHIKIDDEKTLSEIDKLLDYLSEFYDNKNPYPLIYFSENFDMNQIPENEINIKDKYLTAINHPVILELKDIYEKYKIYVGTSNLDKYLITKQHKLIDILIQYHELNDYKKINSKTCHYIGNLILNEITDKFDAKLYMEKYVIALRYENLDNFDKMFVQQFFELIGIAPKIKFF